MTIDIDALIKAKKAAGRLVASPTQVDWFDSCQRKWGFRYLEGLKAPPNRYAALGIDVHQVLENWLKHGTPPDRNTVAGAIALPGLKYLPDPGNAQVEGRFLWEMPEEPFDIQGVIDWIDLLATVVPRFGDHKTTGDFKWMKTPSELRGENEEDADVQSVTYAAYLMFKTGAEEIEARWTYFRTKGRRAAKPVDWATDLETVSEPFDRVLVSCREMAVLHQQKPKAKELPFEPKACDAYGGCPFREECNLSSKERLVSLMAQESLKEKMRRKKAERAGAAEAPAPAPAAAPPAQAPAPAAAPPEQAAPAAAPPAQTAGPAINPPEAAQPAPQQPAPAPQQGKLSLKDKMKARKGAQAQAAATAAAPAAAAPAAAPPAQQPAPAAAPAPAPAPAAAAPAPAPAPAQQPAPAAAPLQPLGEQRFDALFIDCAPMKSNGLSVLPLSNLLAAAAGTDVGTYLDTNPLPAGHGITMTMKTPEGSAAYEALAARAGLVVRGF